MSVSQSILFDIMLEAATIINEPIQIAHSFLDKLLIGLFNFDLLKSIKYYFADLRRFLGSNIGIVLLFKIICLLPLNSVLPLRYETIIPQICDEFHYADRKEAA